MASLTCICEPCLLSWLFETHAYGWEFSVDPKHKDSALAKLVDRAVGLAGAHLQTKEQNKVWAVRL